MTPSEAINVIREHVREGRWEISPHAIERMRGIGRNPRPEIFPRDVGTALINGKHARVSKEDSWVVTGPDTQGDDLDVVVVIEDGVVVVTVF